WSRPAGGPVEVLREVLALRRELEADLGRVQVDEHDVHLHLSGRQRDGVRPLDEGDPGIRMGDELVGAQARGRAAYGHGGGDDYPARSMGHGASSLLRST